MTTVTAPVTPRERVARLAADHIDDLQRGYLADRSRAVAALARLRRGAGRDAGQLPDLWALIDTGPLHHTPDGARPMSENELVRPRTPCTLRSPSTRCTSSPVPPACTRPTGRTAAGASELPYAG
ncbi:hypothetical protein ACR6C2_35430 [Streptomyces sp. INA 01156]